jgi:conjugative transfer signal peptidase TraF
VLENVPKVIYFNVTSSLPQGFYLRIPGKEFRRGDYIVYEPSEEVKKLIVENGWGNGERDFLKKVGAIAGEKYSIDAETLKFEIEGKYIGQVYETDNKGNALPKLRGEFEVPEDYVLPIATNARSFDGRYVGVISEKIIKARVVPILTW